MRTHACPGAVALGVAFTVIACSAPPPPAPPPAPTADPGPPATAAKQEDIPKEPVASGMDCAKAVAQCGGGVCAVTMDNTCDKPVTCDLVILSVCQAETDLVQVKARKRETFAAATKDEVSLSASCNVGRNVSTKVQSLECH